MSYKILFSVSRSDVAHEYDTYIIIYTDRIVLSSLESGIQEWTTVYNNEADGFSEQWCKKFIEHYLHGNRVISKLQVRCPLTAKNLSSTICN